MVWRVLEHDARQWNVSIAAERRANSPSWDLVFSFRPVDMGQRSFWATYPISASSKAALFAQAEKLSDDVLTTFFLKHMP